MSLKRARSLPEWVTRIVGKIETVECTRHPSFRSVRQKWSFNSPASLLRPEPVQTYTYVRWSGRISDWTASCLFVRVTWRRQPPDHEKVPHHFRITMPVGFIRIGFCCCKCMCEAGVRVLTYHNENIIYNNIKVIN